MTVPYDLTVLDRGAKTLTVRCSVCHPDVDYLPLPGHRPSWARALLLADGHTEWETLDRDTVWALSDRIEKTELVALEDHPRVREDEQPRITVRLHFTDAAPDKLPERWPLWFTLGDLPACAWNFDWQNKAHLKRAGTWTSAKIAKLAFDAKGKEPYEARRTALLQALRDGSAKPGALLRARASDPVIVQGLVDAAHRGSDLPRLLAPELAPTYAVAAAQIDAHDGLARLGLLGKDAGPWGALVLARIAEGRAQKNPPRSRARGGQASPTLWERWARRRCLGERAPLGPKEFSLLGNMLGDPLLAGALVEREWEPAEFAALKRAAKSR